jgi:hypothetical protein
MCKVFQLGNSKTGTTSLSAALSLLNYSPWKLPVRRYPTSRLELTKTLIYENIRLKRSIITGFEEYDAFVGSPWYFPDIVERCFNEFPDAKFILLIRDLDEWWDSIIKELARCRARGDFWSFNGDPLEKWVAEKEQHINWFKHNIDHAHRFIPDTQLLEFNINEGWGKLCFFLGKKLPTADFPYLNRNL